MAHIASHGNVLIHALEYTTETPAKRSCVTLRMTIHAQLHTLWNVVEEFPGLTAKQRLVQVREPVPDQQRGQLLG
jgi:hypothetical protein